MGAYRHNWRGSRNGCLTSKEENYVDERIDLSMSDPDLVPLIVQALKRSSSDRDIGCFGDARRVRHKPVLWDLNLVNHVDILSSHFVGQEHRRNTDLKAPDNEDFKIPFTSGIHAPPPRSVELAKKILRTLD